MTRNRTKKFLSMFILLAVILSIFGTRVLADEVIEEPLVNAGTQARGVGIMVANDAKDPTNWESYGTYQRYLSEVSLLCSQKGGRLTDHLLGVYTFASPKNATPKEAYILAELDSNQSDGTQNKSYVQRAWWTTKAGSKGSSVSENDLAKEASAFEKYIKDINGGSIPGYKSASFDMNGSSYSTNSAFDIKYEPSWNNTDEITTTWDSNTQKYRVGPFSINYVNASTNVRGLVRFAGITNMEVYTDSSSEALSRDNWRFVYLNGQRNSSDNSEYPNPNEKFYIELDYKNGMTQITDIKVYFQYMNAAGRYSESKKASFYEETIFGKVFKYFGQKLSYGVEGARWYENTSLEWKEATENKARIKIEKQLLDEDGNRDTDLEGSEYFKFKVTVGDKTDYIKVKAGSSAYTDYYYWKSNESAPSYRVEEIDNDNDDYELDSISNSSGTLVDGKTVTVVAKNRVIDKEKDYGYLKIVKKIRNDSLKSKTFRFNVTISGTFQYYDEIEDKWIKYNNSTRKMEDITINKNSDWKWESGKIKWTGKAPTYKVTEKSGSSYELVSLTPKSGKLVKGRTVTVTATNRRDTTTEDEKAKIHIIKTLDNADQYPESYVRSLNFKFRIWVEDHGTSTVTLTPKREGRKWVWEYTSGYYRWDEDEDNPEYSIEEIDVPEGTEFVSASGDIGSSVDGKTITGTLRDNSSNDHIIDNEFVNKLTDNNLGHLKIEKKVTDDSLQGQEFKFKVTLTGTFSYAGGECKEQTLVLGENERVTVKAGETWTSEDIRWYGTNAPTYTVEEDLTGVDPNVVSTVTPTTGTIKNDNKDGIEAVTVTAVNGINVKTGKLCIIKTLENADKFSEDYISSLVFKFKVHVDGYKDYVVELKGEKVNNSYVWYHEAEFSWKSDEEAPKYTIQEIDLPKGTELVSASGGSTFNKEEKTIAGTLEDSSQDNYMIENNFINKLDEKTGKLIINKKVLDGSLEGKKFKFDVTLKGTFQYDGHEYKDQSYTFEAVVEGGKTWTSEEIKWCGTDAPTYTVTEKESGIAEQVDMINNSGTITSNQDRKDGDPEDITQVVVATNDAKFETGKLKITKNLENGALADESYVFRITVDGYEPYEVEIKADETYTTDEYKWAAGEEAPHYKVEEIETRNAVFVSMTNGEGQLGKDQTIEVVAINRAEQHSGKIKIKKNVLTDEKTYADSITDEFTVNIRIAGKFVIEGETIDGSKTITATVKAGGTYETPEITWYGDKAPTYSVEEVNLPKGWKLENISNGNGELSENNSEEVVITNSFKTRVIIELTLDLGGTVWEDRPLDETAKNTSDSIVNGKIDNTEYGLDGVEVNVYKVVYSGNTVISRELAYIYDSEGNISGTYPLFTENGGKWVLEDVPVPAVSEEEKNAGLRAAYDVEFVYDGQTYEPTTFLATANGNTSEYLNATSTGRDAYLNDSHALDFDRDDVNSRITQVAGETEIDGDGDTTGKVLKPDGTDNAIYYTSEDYHLNTSENTSRKVSSLQTTNENGRVYDVFKAKATTLAGGLAYPFDSRVHLEGIDKYIDELGAVEKYKYSATYPYTQNINLGLKRREEADLGATKDLVSAKVVVNGKVMEYKFNTLADLTGDVITRQLTAQSQGFSYELGLYKTDYYYRAEMYKANTDYDKVEQFYKELNTAFDTSEMEVYLNYNIRLDNESPSYVVGINEVNDYFDNSFRLITETEKRYNKDAGSSGDMVVVADGSTVSVNGGTPRPISWNVVDTDIYGSDKVTYNEMTTNFDGTPVRLASGEHADINVTFAVEKQDSNGVKNAIELGQKANVAEIANYTTYYTDGKLAGKIDRDSAPANINIMAHNEKAWYEDDTDSAPILNLKITGSERQVTGTAWEDSRTGDSRTMDIDGQKAGNGIIDDKEALIGGLTTELIEKVSYGDNKYDFLWPTNKPLDALGGASLEDVTGFDSTIETSRVQDNGLKVGQYKFIGVPAGEYVVRFLYGNDKTKLEDSFGISGEPEALKIENNKVLPFYDGEDDGNNILTANYDGKATGKVPAVYNGQDFKVTTYNNTQNGNKAKDSEARRLEVMANSETITNGNGTVLNAANYSNMTINKEDGSEDVVAEYKLENHTELYSAYDMFADTDKINLNIESTNESSIQRGILTVEGNVYEVTDINAGLVERPETAVVLDKEISSIKLTTSDNSTIFDAEYDINYKLVGKSDTKNHVVVGEVDGKYIIADVALKENSIGTNVLQSIDKVEDKEGYTYGANVQNFRYINVDELIMQGATIEIGYSISALNVGEIDRISENLDKAIAEKIAQGGTAKDAILEILSTDITEGEYLGKAYYGEHDTSAQVIVTSRVRQVVDYVDNDAVFSTSLNQNVDSSWKNATINEILGNGFEENRLLDKEIIKAHNLLDKKDAQYATTQRNNIILSVDSIEETNTLSNKGFEANLKPFVADENSYASVIKLTTTRAIATQDDANDLTFDNLAEIVKIENTAGRRDITSIPGNSNPSKGEFEASITERDSSATELITLAPPTGIEAGNMLTLQVLAIVTVALVIVAAGVVIIKKKVLVK